MPAQPEVIPAPLTSYPTAPRLKAGSNKAQSPPCLASAAEVRELTPNAWPKWTYGPNGEQCWYSGQKPFFAKARPAQAAVIALPLSYVPADAGFKSVPRQAEYAP